MRLASKTSPCTPYASRSFNKHIQNSSGNPGTAQSNTAERKHIQNSSGNLGAVQSNTTERKHIQNSSGNLGISQAHPNAIAFRIQVGILVHGSTQEHSDSSENPGTVKSNTNERKHIQNQVGILVVLLHYSQTYL